MDILKSAFGLKLDFVPGGTGFKSISLLWVLIGDTLSCRTPSVACS